MFGYSYISKIFLGIVLFFYVSVSHNWLFGQSYPLKNNAFLHNVLSKSNSIKHIQTGRALEILDSIQFKKDQFQDIIKTRKTSYVVTRGTGLVFKQEALKDSSISYTRIDSTKYDGYNFDDIKFEYNDTLFSIGGFGFWRNNGQIRYFTENKEWELLFPELTYGISNRDYWNFDSQKGLFYIMVNTSIDEQSLITINLSEKSWKIQELPKSFFADILLKNEYPVQIQLNNQTGSLLCFSNVIYYLDLSKQIIKRANNNQLLNFFNKNKIRESSAYHDGTLIYAFNNVDQSVDSIKLDLENFSIVYQNNNVFTFRVYIIAIIFFIISLTAFLLIVNKRKKKMNLLALNEFESIFINNLLIIHGHQMDIESLNYILGLSKKSIEIQKKNRSEFLNKLNQKFKELLNTEDNIIMRVKDEEDKRVFVYQLNPAYFNQVQDLL